MPAAFGTATGTTPTVGFDFLDGSSWAGVSSPNWLLDPWTTWLKANPNAVKYLTAAAYPAPSGALEVQEAPTSPRNGRTDRER